MFKLIQYFFSKFFGNIEILDINQRGAFLIKLNASIIALYIVFYAVFNDPGDPFPFWAKTRLDQLLSGWVFH